MADVLTTARLTLEPWSPAADRLLEQLARVPAVVRHIGDGTSWSDARIAAVAEQATRHWEAHGFGWRLAREQRRPVGFIALSFAGEGAGVPADEHEIGWWLAPDAWGRGLATEGAAAVREEAFGRVRAPHILARIQPGNAASLSVARATGLQPEGEGRGRVGERFLVLGLSAAGWRERPRPVRPATPA